MICEQRRFFNNLFVQQRNLKLKWILYDTNAVSIALIIVGENMGLIVPPMFAPRTIFYASVSPAIMSIILRSQKILLVFMAKKSMIQSDMNSLSLIGL